MNFTDYQLYSGNYSHLNEWKYTVGVSENSISVLHLNIRSIGKHWDTLILEITLSKANFDILILSEIFCSNEDISFYNLEGFTRIHRLREGKRVGGIVLFINKDKLNFTCISLDHINTYEHITGRLELVRANERTSFIIHAVYRPPTSSSGFTITETIQELDMTFNFLKSYKNLLFIGDTNINIRDELDSNTQKYVELLSSWGLKQGIWDFTREEIRGNNITQTCIDHIYYRLSNSFNTIFTGIVHSKISDH